MSKFDKGLSENFIEVKKGMFLAKDDERFLEKYLRFFPNDAKKLYEYGEQLESEGKLSSAWTTYQKALKNGYLSAEVKMEEIKKKQHAIHFEYYNTKRRNKSIFPLLLLSLLNLCLLTGLILFISNFFFKENIHPTFNSNEPVIDNNLNENSEVGLSELEVPLLITVVQNSLERYREVNGSYPNNLSDIFAVRPNNWLSSLKADFNYEGGKDRYVLEWGGIKYDEEEGSKDTNLLSIVHYPDANQLGVMKGKLLLAIYPVATGNKALPFNSSQINERVVNPNGGDGPLGTRGLVLQDNYAIHGTNNPNSIGKDVTHGCLRMYNQDIESLYPYISLGTPFHVLHGEPQTNPVYPSGLPILAEPLTDKMNTKETAITSFEWKS